ncbi:MULTISPECIES: caspase family protein [Novosphingobium]|uniref:caspase family protein n=1 Tax=Novosphingobium TaxID=165696 RepID=UPI00138E49BB|nr:MULTISPECIES: caspase family protein [Novosphingobium]
MKRIFGRKLRLVGFYVILTLGFATSPISAHSAEKFAVLVGVDDQLQPSDPRNRVNVLSGPANDIVLMRRLLIEQYGFVDDAQHIVTLRGSAASVAAIRRALVTDMLAKVRANPGSTVVFYFSGHGARTSDLDNDEGDGEDETLVAYDSRSDTGRDIVDDELEDWLATLKPYVGHIAVILDSCHSGTATRAPASAAATARRLSPNPNMRAPVSLAAGQPRDIVIPRAAKLAVISGSLADELSYEGEIETPSGTVVHGYLTYHLVQALKQRPSSSYRAAVARAREAVLRVAASQHPQVEGEIDSAVFGAGDAVAAPIELRSATPDGKLVIGAGSAHGVRVGGLLAIYRAGAPKTVGDADKIADARVDSVGLGTASAIILGTPKALPLDSTVVVVTPNFGMDPLLVKLDTLGDQSVEPADRVMLAALQDRLAGNELLRAAKPGEPWSLAVQRGCLTATGKVIPDGPAAAGCESSYYIATRQELVPIMGFWVRRSDPNAPVRLGDALTKKAKQLGLRSLTNSNSTLDNLLRLDLMRVKTGPAPGGGLTIVSQTLVPGDGIPSLRVGEYFAFRLTNLSNEKLYASLIALGTSGSIQVLTPTPGGDAINPNNFIMTKPPQTAGAPLGIETYKVIASTRSDVDYSLLASPGATKSASTAPLAWLLAQSTAVKSRDPNAAEGLTSNEWTTAQLDVLIRQ